MSRKAQPSAKFSWLWKTNWVDTWVLGNWTSFQERCILFPLAVPQAAVSWCQGGDAFICWSTLISDVTALPWTSLALMPCPFSVLTYLQLLTLLDLDLHEELERSGHWPADSGEGWLVPCPLALLLVYLQVWHLAVFLLLAAAAHLDLSKGWLF